jgi:non-homologous end joining protein Ku
MRTVWKGTLSFGLVSVPVGLVAAQGRPTLGLRRVARATGAPVRHRRWDPVADRELGHAETVAALELAPGRFARLEPEELAALRAGREPAPALPPPPAPELAPLPAAGTEDLDDGADDDTGPAPVPDDAAPAAMVSEEAPEAPDEASEPPAQPDGPARRPPEPGTIAVEGFVDVAEITPELYDRAYWLAPEPAGRRPYRLLLAALADAGQAAVCRVAIRDREHLAIVRPGDGLLVLHTLHWPEDVRQADRARIAAGVAETPLSPAELELARRLIGSLERDFDPAEHRDDARARIAGYLRRKGAGAAGAPAPEEPAAEPAGDLMAALRASLAAAGHDAEASPDGTARRAS